MLVMSKNVDVTRSGGQSMGREDRRPENAWVINEDQVLGVPNSITSDLICINVCPALSSTFFLMVP
jgi:hypothetical protein